MSLMLAHGIGGIQNLPIPRWVFFVGAAGILVVSFLASCFLWPRPVLAEKNRGGRSFPDWLERFLLSRGLARRGRRALVRVCSRSSGSARSSARTTAASTSPRPSSTSSSGSGCRSSRRCSGTSGASSTRGARRRRAWAGRRTVSASATRRRSSTRPGSGRWPAAFLLLLFVAMELSYTDPSNPRALALAIGDLQRDHLVRRGALRLGGVVRERRRLRGRLPAPLADQPVRPARGRPPRTCVSRSRASRSGTRLRGRSPSSR